jgi:Uncharacterized protein conserved in bacteria (DUF2255)
MPDGDLRHLAEVEEISIGFTRPDGSTGSTPVWVVQAGEEIFVRSIRGRRGGWSRRLRANPDGEAGDRAHTHPVRPPGRGRRHRGGGHPRLFGQVRRQPLRGAAADRGGGRRDAAAGAPTVAIVATGRAPDPGPHRAGQGRPDPGRRPPLHRLHPTAPARTRTSRLRVIRRRRQGSATGSRAGVRARNLATNSPPKRAGSSLGWDHAAAAKVRHCEGCSEARV